MKKAIFMSFMALLFSMSISSCREQTEKERVMEEMKDEGATVKEKRDGDETKIKMETENKEVKIKEEDGETKIKQKTENDDN